MPLPKLSLLQSRLAASLMASVMLLLLYFVFSSPHFAYAADVDSIRPEDHNHDRLWDVPFPILDDEALELRELPYESEFLGIDRGIIGRAPTTNEPTGLTNNVPVTTNIEMGQTVSYIFHNDSLWAAKSTTEAFLLPSHLRKRDFIEGDVDAESGDSEIPGEQKLRPRQANSSTFRTLYVSVTTCLQPEPVDNTSMAAVPQLQLYISQNSNNTNPGPGKTQQDMVELVEGYAMHEVNSMADVYIGVYGKNDTAYSGVWSAEIAASIDAPYHYYHNITDSNLSLVDSDSASAFLLADNPKKFDNGTSDSGKWTKATPPYVLFASNVNDRKILGLSNSFCGLQQKAQIKPSTTGEVASGYQTALNYKMQFGLTKRDGEVLPKQQFYVKGLTGASQYNVVLAIRGNSTDSGANVVGGGGQIFRMTTFRTLSDSNCALIFDLPFCTNVAYAVPSNNTLNTTELGKWYDDQAQGYFQNFQKAMQQVPCETTSSAQYSLAVTCDNCTASYKEWLCAVSIPRCTDFSATGTFLQPRAMGQSLLNGSTLPIDVLNTYNRTQATNGSRVPLIDTDMKPGPYKEILPCDDLCYNVVKSCPASLSFNCPLPSSIGFNESYSMTGKGGVNANRTCNWPGRVVGISAGQQNLPSAFLVLSIGVVVLMFI
ncbi:stretch-activated Ca2+-permeable channel component-domain-containing protein [Halenospora varia]|nr:stretch-activated Ca2+-permeable channel component-domain-containing protein [Halenospora varia]